MTLQVLLENLGTLLGLFFLIYGLVQFCYQVWELHKKHRDYRKWCQSVKPSGVQMDIQKRGGKYRMQ
ncbi:MAG: hypothetical protein LKH74_04095 [Levilactobacillus sp.]|jgi:hypothetical protein|uniref:Uncharacterized protein n=1 Tax=Levilactobacillus suantsaiihabitans TaxID=2487722 RepID=A0A4Z0JEH0_9LACO|nr:MULTISPECIES: hypothetical protein [Levilactobacillus]MCI1553083.1 hypothetical protein [Levilactobacillus sp.]MCI1598738.1 hypothetical protein [Levilactobacillus sp.]MCI1605087.1 hypothetical protein [Levilactobacillus sp.]TGD20467.1 hypothetical protein EGT51_01580 [Levilactobacillus suantsaiihabitans]